MKKIIAILSLVVFFASCKGQTTNAVQTIDVKTFAEKLQTTENPQLLDVRTPQEYAVEHITNATNVNWNASDFVTKASNYDKTKPVFVYCLSGGRSKAAASKLAESCAAIEAGTRPARSGNIVVSVARMTAF